METMKIDGKKFNIKPKNRFNPFKPTIYVAESASENTQPKAGALLQLAAAAYIALTPATGVAQEAQQPPQQTAEQQPDGKATKDTVFDGLYSKFTPSYVSIAGSIGKDRGNDFWNSGARLRLVTYPVGNVFSELSAAGTVGEFALDEQGAHRQVTARMIEKIGYDFLREKAAEKGVFGSHVLIPVIVGGVEKASRNRGAFVTEETLPQVGLGVLYMNEDKGLQITGDYRRIFSGDLEAKFGLDGKVEGDVAQFGASYDIDVTGTVLVAQARIHRIKGDLEGAVNGMPVRLESTSKGYGGLFGVIQDTRALVKGTYVGGAVNWMDTRLDNKSSVAAIANDHNIKQNWMAVLGLRPSEYVRFLPDDAIATVSFGRDNSNEVAFLLSYRLGGK